MINCFEITEQKSSAEGSGGRNGGGEG